LNTPLRKEAKDSTEKRRFIDLSKKGNKGFSEGYTDQTLYRYEEYFTEPAKAIELFDPIPFLNGGLFECLDFPENKSTGETERRYDGFSSTKEKQAVVPDVLFFGDEIEIDVTKDLEDESDKKKKKVTKRIVKVRGLLRTLNDYKFTIAENTPLEEEIALDPELLGKVFENLLASYNPETKGTARKQTGSFYTPREIVNYMVDESLKMYLFQKLSGDMPALVELGKQQTQMFGNEVKKGQAMLLHEVPIDQDSARELGTKLTNLFDHSLEGNPFDETETDLLIRSISNCKILDPACGSGAFPMGILHRMVHLLARLDPNNKKWKEELLRKAQGDL
jgi:adenine-specific DNA-methyltransferase